MEKDKANELKLTKRLLKLLRLKSSLQQRLGSCYGVINQYGERVGKEKNTRDQHRSYPGYLLIISVY